MHVPRLRARCPRAVLALLVLAGASIAGCGSGDKTGDAKGVATSAASARHVTIGVSFISQQIPILASITKVFQDEGRTHGFDTVVSDPDNDAAKQVQQVRAMIQRKVDALLVSAVNPEALQPVLDEAVKAGIPVFMNGTPPQKAEHGLMTSNFDWHAYGYDVGESFAQCINERYGGKGEVGLITTTAISGPVVSDRMAGEKAAISKLAPGVTVAAQADAKSNRVKAVEAARAMLRAHPDIVGFTGIGDSEVLGAMQAFSEAGKDPKKGCFVGLDASEEGLKALGDGTLYAEFDPNYDDWVRFAAVVLPEMARDPKSPLWNAQTVLFAPAKASA